MVKVPVRAVVLLLAAMENATVPLPVPLAPEVTVIHEGALLTAVHVQIAFEVVKVTVLVVAAALVEKLLTDRKYEQETPA